MDKRLKALREHVLKHGCSLAVVTALGKAEKYTGILEVVVKAGDLQEPADTLGVSYQAVQQWLKVGYVPLARIPELESIYGVPRTELMNPKYAAVLVEPNFSSDV